MGRLEDDLRSYIEAHYRSINDCAKKIGMSPQTLHSLLRRGVTSTNFQTTMTLCKGLDLDPMELWNERLAFSNDLSKRAFVPCFGNIAAGEPIEPELADESFPIPTLLYERYPNAFMLRVNGTSMNKILPDGSLVLVDPRDNIDSSGKICAVMVGNQNATVKRVVLYENGIALQPMSTDPTHRELVFRYDENDEPEVRMIGQVVWQCSYMG